MKNLSILLENMSHNFNVDQHCSYDVILSLVKNQFGALFYVKIHERHFCTVLWSQGKLVICVASLRIPSFLLDRGCTAHLTFKIPFEVNEYCICSINKIFENATMLHVASLIIWDKIPMQHWYYPKVVDQILQNFCESNSFLEVWHCVRRWHSTNTASYFEKCKTTNC
jgi:hypothetical protein